MKLVFRTLAFHFSCILIFTLFYYYLSSGFNNSSNQKRDSLLDMFLLSTTIQAGVGISDLYPISYYNKIVMILQQFLMISTHVFSLYIFNL